MNSRNPNPTGTPQDLLHALERGAWNEYLTRVYGPDQTDFQKGRYCDLLKRTKEMFGNGEVTLFQAPGRAELSGNHTDHNNGLVLAAAVHLDCLAAASAQDGNHITYFSEGHPDIQMDLSDLSARADEVKTTKGLIRGVANWMADHEYQRGGFNVCMTSNITMGKGLSSSAAVEVLVGRIFNHFYNHNRVSDEDLARAGKHAENKYFKKNCGLMDQMSSARSGLILIDFKEEDQPDIKNISFDFSLSGYQPAVVDTGGSHAGSPWDYNSIEYEMRSVARHFNQETVRGLTMARLVAETPRLRDKVEDRAILRVIHFLQENERVLDQAKALDAKRIDDFLRLVNESGDSSWRLLQNCYVPISYQPVESSRSTQPVRPDRPIRYEQPIPLALSLTLYFLKDRGACRIHGGGFDGTILVFIPNDRMKDYISFMESVFGRGSVIPLRFRNEKDTLSGVKKR